MKSYNHFTLEERESLSELYREKKSIRKIAEELGRSPSSVSREIKRNFSKKRKRYTPWGATVNYIVRRKNCKRKYKLAEPELCGYVKTGLEQFWSPEEISGRGALEGYDISFSTIYRAIKRKLIPEITAKQNLRRRGKKRYNHSINCNSIHPEHTIHERPQIVEEKQRIGGFEGDTVLGAIAKGCIATYVDRKSKLLVAALCTTKQSEEIVSATTEVFKRNNLRAYTITYDNGSEFAEFAQIEKNLNVTVYFADTHAPWQRGLNENTNGLLRFFYPKGTDFTKITQEELDEVVNLINNRPRKCLGYLSPLEFFHSCCT